MMQAATEYWHPGPPRPHRSGRTYGVPRRRGIAVSFPCWLFTYLPNARGEGVADSRLLTAAAIIGACERGVLVGLGQVSTYGPVRHANLHFTERELESFWAFAQEAHLAKITSTIRTAVFIGLNVPGWKEGIVSPPAMTGTEWTMGLNQATMLLIDSGVMDKRLWENGGRTIWEERFAKGIGVEEQETDGIPSRITSHRQAIRRAYQQEQDIYAMQVNLHNSKPPSPMPRKAMKPAFNACRPPCEEVPTPEELSRRRVPNKSLHDAPRAK